MGLGRRHLVKITDDSEIEAISLIWLIIIEDIQINFLFNIYILINGKVAIRHRNMLILKRVASIFISYLKGYWTVQGVRDLGGILVDCTDA